MNSFLPRSEEEVCDVVRWAMSRREALSVYGSGSRAGLGHAVPMAHGLGLSGLAGIASYDPRELVLTAAAGTSLAEIEEALEPHGQHLAFEPPRPRALFGGEGAGTLGGVFLANLSGPRRVHAGAARDHLLGVRAVNGRGEAWKAGGKVIKNVTGYDLPRLLAGSWGTLSVVTEITCKVLPAPANTRTLCIPAPDASQAVDWLVRIAASPLTPTGLAYLPATQRCMVRFEGTRAGVGERVQALSGLLSAAAVPVAIDDDEARAMWRDLRDGGPVAHASIVVKATLPPAAAPELCRLLASCSVHDWYLDCGGAWLWVGLPADNAVAVIARLRAQLRDRGSVVVMRAPDAVKSAVGVLGPAAPALAALMRRIKLSFDPLSLLNPGRMYPS